MSNLTDRAAKLWNEWFGDTEETGAPGLLAVAYKCPCCKLPHLGMDGFQNIKALIGGDELPVTCPRSKKEFMVRLTTTDAERERIMGELGNARKD